MMHIAPVDFVSVMTQNDPDSKAKCSHFGSYSCNGPCPRHRADAYPASGAQHRTDKP